MAGTYLDYPGNRMAVAEDGTFLARVNRAGDDDTVTDLALLGSESNASVGFWPDAGAGVGASGYVAVIFPEPRDIAGWFIRCRNYDWDDVVDDTDLEWSTDTSDGIDGTWTSASVPWLSAGQDSTALDSWRTNVEAAATVIRCNGLRLRYTGAFNDLILSHLHLFGERYRTHGLAVWGEHARITPALLDWGDVALASAADRQIRVMNTSASLIATGIEVTLDAPTNTTPPVDYQHYVSLDMGDSFAASVSLGQPLEPGDVSGPILLRRVTPPDADTGPWAARIRVRPTGWRTSTGASVEIPYDDDYAYILEGDVDGLGADNIPVVWWTTPPTAKAGDNVEVRGYGFEDTQPGDGHLMLYLIDGTPIEPVLVTWEAVTGDADELAPGRTMSKAANRASPAHQRIVFILPVTATDPLVSIVVQTG